MTSSSEKTPQQWESLSAAADGEASADELKAACQAWTQLETQTAWHAWAVIGDVMRSEDLATRSGCQSDFLSRLRERMADEPVILAPAPLQILEPPVAAPEAQVVNGKAAVGAVQRRWMAPSAWAAGVLLVTGAWWMMPAKIGQGPSAGMTLVQAPASSPVQEANASATAVMVRNPALDQYLAAHRQYVQGPALAAPGGVRQVAVEPSAP